MSKRPPSKPARPRDPFANLETEMRQTDHRISRIEQQLADDRLGRIERATEEFQAMVRGAMTVQQDQIANLYRTVAAQQTRFDELRDSVQDLRNTINQVIQEWQAYLRTIHPRQ